MVKFCLLRSHPLLRSLSSTGPDAKAASSHPPGHIATSGMRKELLKDLPARGQKPSAGQTGGTHLRNTEPGLGLSAELCGASAWALLGLPGTSNWNTMSLEDSLFFTIVRVSDARSNNKLKGSFPNLPNNVKIYFFSFAQFLHCRKLFLHMAPNLAEAFFFFFKLVNE